MARQTVSEIVKFNDDARQSLDHLHSQRVSSSTSIEAASEFLKTASKWDGNGGPSLEKIEPLPVLIFDASHTRC
jgi:hypothetical protein